MTMKWKQVAGVGALVLVFSFGVTRTQAAPVSVFAQGYGQQGGYGPGGGQGGYRPGDQGGWDAPPSDFRNDVGRQGFHDGIEGARKDVENHRRPNVNNRDEYRHPNVSGPVRHDYREGFRRGYHVAMQHMVDGGGDRRPY